MQYVHVSKRANADIQKDTLFGIFREWRYCILYNFIVFYLMLIFNNVIFNNVNNKYLSIWFLILQRLKEDNSKRSDF